MAVNDADSSALVAIAMNSGTEAAREAGNMVDLDSDPTKLLEVVETGKLGSGGCLGCKGVMVEVKEI